MTATRTRKPADKVLTDTIAKGQQDAIATRVLQLQTGHKVRLIVRSDSYSFQSYAHADVWSPATLSWNRIVNIHHSNMATAAGLCYGAPNAHSFAKDMTSLLEQAKAILA